MRRRFRLIHQALLVLCVLLLAACSSTTFVYNRLDFFIPWQIGKYVDLDRAQETHLEDLLLPFLRWHRAEELPVYLAWLNKVETQLNDPVTPRQLEGLGEEIQVAWLRIQARGLDWMISVGETLSDEQTAEFMESLREQQEEYEEDDLSRDDDEYREDARENLEDNIEDFLGRLNDEQEAMLDAAAGGLWRADKTWLAERERWLQRLGQILQREPGWQDELRRAIAERENYNSPEYLATYEHNARIMFTVVADILNSRTDRQDRHLRRELGKLRKDLQALIADDSREVASG